METFSSAALSGSRLVKQGTTIDNFSGTLFTQQSVTLGCINIFSNALDQIVENNTRSFAKTFSAELSVFLWAYKEERYLHQLTR